MQKSEIIVGQEYAVDPSGYRWYNRNHPFRAKVLDLNHEYEVERTLSSGTVIGVHKKKGILIEYMENTTSPTRRKGDTGILRDGRYIFHTWKAEIEGHKIAKEYKEKKAREEKRQDNAYERIKPYLEKVRSYVSDTCYGGEIKLNPTEVEAIIKLAKEESQS